MNKVAIYHFTDKSVKRPIVNEKQMALLRDFAKKYGTIEREYLDKTLKKCEQKEKRKLIQEIGEFDVLVTKDFYHISKNTGTCIELLQQFLAQGVQTYSMEDGCFTFTDVPFDEKLNVVLYHSKYVDNTQSANKWKRGNEITVQTQIEIMKLFIKQKTQWKIADIYVDEAKGQSDDKQVNLLEMIRNSKKYDLVLCKNFNNIHWRTAKFCKRRNDMKLDIFSLREGYLKYQEDSNN